MKERFTRLPILDNHHGLNIPPLSKETESDIFKLIPQLKVPARVKFIDKINSIRSKANALYEFEKIDNQTAIRHMKMISLKVGAAREVLDDLFRYSSKNESAKNDVAWQLIVNYMDSALSNKKMHNYLNRSWEELPVVITFLNSWAMNIARAVGHCNTGKRGSRGEKITSIPYFVWELKELWEKCGNKYYASIKGPNGPTKFGVFCELAASGLPQLTISAMHGHLRKLHNK